MPKSDKYAERTLDFVDRLRDVEKFEDVASAFSKELQSFGFDYVTCMTLPKPGEAPNSGLIFNTRPVEYIERYSENNYIEHDPVIKHLRSASRPFSWGDVRSQRRMSVAERNIIDEGQEFGMRDGLIVPIVTMGDSVSLFSPCGLEPDLTERARSATEIIGIIGQQALQRTRPSPQVQKSKVLSRREREVMHWVAVGKSDGEIADILNLSESTVRGYADSAKRRLGVYKRTAAVAQAILRGEVSI